MPLTPPCKSCGKTRKVQRLRKNHIEGEYICQPCTNALKKITYIRVCDECGDEKKVANTKEANSKLCKKCSAKRLGKLMSEKNRKYPDGYVKRYTVTCPTCGKTREVTRNPKYAKTNNCLACTQILSGLKRRGKKRKSPKPKENKMRYFRFCPECDGDEAIKQVASKANAGMKLCKKHSQLANAKNRIGKKPKSYDMTNRNKKRVPKEAIEKQIAINRKHKKLVEQEKKTIPEAKLSDEEMIANFLKNNKPSVIITDTGPIGHVSGQIYIKEY